MQSETIFTFSTTFLGFSDVLASSGVGASADAADFDDDAGFKIRQKYRLEGFILVSASQEARVGPLVGARRFELERPACPEAPVDKPFHYEPGNTDTESGTAVSPNACAICSVSAGFRQIDGVGFTVTGSPTQDEDA
ncbi:hypothetical protein GALMADRAFT_213448 [Galerina marginata CBS 339.88]|uniref:Uncharacterized protein n=1 Tax=Galerina marginata (strain CBS 339.88) TaxID=685588 RepID=A0A067SWC4_GALM3|nr:hypothetical protein GALMADRAFT_213448 [Galerina marginata CBS 339.88]